MNTHGGTIDRNDRMRAAVADAARDLRRAVTDGGAGLAGLPLALGTLLSLPLRPAALTMIRLGRRVAGWHRRRAADVLGRPIDSPYQEDPERPGDRYHLWVREPATWPGWRRTSRWPSPAPGSPSGSGSVPWNACSPR